MKDLRVIKAQALLNITSISPIRGFLPVSIVVLGEHLDQASQVFYNDILAPEFVPQSSTRLIVRVPQSQIGQEFRSIRAYSAINRITPSALLAITVGNPIAEVEGMDRLIQQWMVIFYTTPGSDIFDPQSGGGGRSIVGRNTDKFGKGVSADLALAIDRTQAELLRLQAQTPGIPLAEKLLSTQLLSLNFDSSNATLSAVVGITNMLGNTAQATVT